jgi:hypothetical protein
VHQNLTLRKIAAEAGLTPACLSQLAHKFGIPLRRVGAGHRNPLAQLGSPADFPPGIWAAFRRSGGERRIRRILLVMKHPTFETAAQNLRTEGSVISSQVSSLEKDLGVTIITPARGKPGDHGHSRRTYIRPPSPPHIEATRHNL